MSDDDTLYNFDYTKNPDTNGIKFIKHIIGIINSRHKGGFDNNTSCTSYSFNGKLYTQFPKYITIDFNHSALKVEKYNHDNIPDNSLIIPENQFNGIGFYIQDKEHIYGFNISENNNIVDIIYLSDRYYRNPYDTIFKINYKGGSNSKTTKKYNNLNIKTQNNKTKHKKLF